MKLYHGFNEDEKKRGVKEWRAIKWMLAIAIVALIAKAIPLGV